MDNVQKANPFLFCSSVPLVELTAYKARNLQELKEIIEVIDGSSVYFHTHQYVREHHFLSEEYPSDFAYWVAEVLQEKSLGEKLAVLDLRDFPTIRSLREKIVALIRDDLERRGRVRDVQPGLEFHFCKTISVVISTPYQAADLATFRKCLRKVDVHCLYYHLMEYRIRETGESNDFSRWIREGLGRENLAKAIEDLDPYFYPLEQTREKILKILAREKYVQRVRGMFSDYAPKTEVGRLLREKETFSAIKRRLHKWFVGGQS
jgi:hypothetical protein